MEAWGMKHSAGFAMVVVTLALAGAANGQSCTMAVTGFEANYALGTNATTSCSGPTGTSGTCSYNQSTAAIPNFTGGGCAWRSATDSVTSLSFHDVGTWPCPPSGTLTQSYDGDSGISSSSLNISASNSSYTFEPEPIANVIENVSGCSSGSGPGTPAAYGIGLATNIFTSWNGTAVDPEHHLSGAGRNVWRPA